MNAANAEDYYYWPEFGTFAEHNNWATPHIKAPEANRLGATGRGVKVAILDEGLADYEPGLRSKVIAYKNFLPGESVRTEHGTMVASTIASDLNSAVGIQGVAPDVSLIVAKVCYRNGCEWEAIRKAVNWAVEQGAQIINMSISGSPDAYMQSTLKAAVDQGVLIVAAEGNWGCNPYANWGMNYRCVQGSITEGTQANYPIAGLIAAGASDQRGGRVSTMGWSSSHGPNLDLLAPGIEVSAYDAYAASNGFGGTSSATPYISATAALLLSVKPDLTPAQIQAILQATASKPFIDPPKVWDSCTRNTETQQWSCNQIVESTQPRQYYYGAGVVDAEAAVKLTKKIVAGQVLPPASFSQSDLKLTIQWDGGPADLYLNSELVQANAVSGFEYQGFKNQSVSIQLRRAGAVSFPAIAMVAPELIPDAPVIVYSSAMLGELTIRVNNLDAQYDRIWRTKDYGSWNEDQFSAVFVATDGHEYACRAYFNHYSETTSFNCEIPTSLTQVTGHLRLLGKSAHLGAESDLVDVAVIGGVPIMDVTSTYESDGQPRFDWDPVPNAGSYRYGYGNEGITGCIQDTTVKVANQPVEPRGIYISAFSNDDCSGAVLANLPSLTFIPLPPKPAKPTGITIKEAGYNNVEFEVPNRNPASYWRIYRSDGLVMQIQPGQRMAVGMQANEDLDNKTFSYRFAEQFRTTWMDSWSELSDPIQVTLPSFDLPTGSCFNSRKSTSVNCAVIGVSQAQHIRVEYLDGDFQVLAAEEISNDNRSFRTGQQDIVDAVYVRASPTVGTPGTRYSWYRRGAGTIIEIGKNNYSKYLAQKK